MSLIQVNHSHYFLSTDNSFAIQSVNGQNWDLQNDGNGWFRIVAMETNKCLQPRTGNRLDDCDMVILKDIKEDTEYQLWKFIPIQNQTEWSFIVNKCERKNKRIHRMCLDVRGGSEDERADVIVYHKKREPGGIIPGNQWWKMI